MLRVRCFFTLLFVFALGSLLVGCGQDGDALAHISLPTLFTYLLVSWCLGYVGWLVIRRRRRPDPVTAWVGLITLGFVAITLTVPDLLPLHSHNSFVARADCAWLWHCEEDPAGAWMPPIFHAYGLLLHLQPYGLAAIGLTSVFLSALSVALLAMLVRRLFARFGQPSVGDRAALWTACILALHPAFIRLSAGGSMWPFVLACLLGAAHLALLALDEDRPGATLAALGLLSLASLSNFIAMQWLALAILAPIAWRHGSGRFRPRLPHLVGGVAALAFVLPYVFGAAMTIFGAEEGGLPFAGSLWDLSQLWQRWLFGDPSITPTALGILALVGLCLSLTLWWRPLLPLTFAFLSSEWILSAQLGLHVGYPNRYLHGYLSIAFSAALAAAVASWLIGKVPGKARIAATCLLAALCLAQLPFLCEGLRFLSEKRALAAELEALEPAMEHIPPHDLLVVAPRIQNPLGAKAKSRVEAFFPQGIYKAVLERRGIAPAPIFDIPYLVNESPELPGPRVLFYLGSTLRSWLKSEIATGHVPIDNVDRPLLRALSARYTLEPVHTFEIPTENPHDTEVRVGADRHPTVSLGFYWLHPREIP